MKRLSMEEKNRRAALILFDRGGADAVSMRRMADAAGIPPMPIYRHFSSRDALLNQLSDNSFGTIADEWQVGPGILTRCNACRLC